MSIETSEAATEALTAHFRELLKRKLGVEVNIDLVVPTALALLTGVEARQKPIRLIDRR